MKKMSMLWMTILLAAAMLVGCGRTPEPETTPTEPASTAQTEEVTEESTQETTEPVTEAPTQDEAYEGEAPEYEIAPAYVEAVQRYHVAFSENWDEKKYADNGMSPLAAEFSDPMKNVGFGFVDLNNDDQEELIIGGIQDAQTKTDVMEIWTLVDDKPVMLAQGTSADRYILQFVEEDNMWYVANECVISDSTHGTFYSMVIDGNLEIMQGIVYDAAADPANPWFMAYDMGWDVSNDDPIDEDMANAILETNRLHYTAVEYIPYIFYK